MFLASRMCETAEEAKAWVEANIPEAERRNWVVLVAEGEAIDIFEKKTPQGLADGDIKAEPK